MARLVLATMQICLLVAARTNHLATGCLGTLALMPALAENRRNDLAFALATQRSFPSWCYMLDHGPGTFWEHWNNLL